MSITEIQWNMLVNSQKEIFEKELGKKFNNANLPNRNDILIFLENNNIATNIKRPKEDPLLEEIEKLWEKVINHLNK